MPGSIHAIIVSHNTRDELLACLSSLSEHPPEAIERITVVDNGSNDATVEALRVSHPNIDVIALDKNVGFGAANNVAARRSTSDYLLFLNSDTKVPAGAIDLLFRRLRERGAVAAGPRLADAAGRPEVSFGSMLSPWTEAIQLVRQRLAASSTGFARRYIQKLTAAESTVDWVSGACLLVERNAFIGAGAFDERYFMYEEDVDLCASLRAKGRTILFTPGAEITHLRGRSIGRAAKTTGASHYDRSHLAFYRKHSPRWAPWLRLWLRLRGRPIE